MKLNCSSAIKLLQKLLTFTGIQARQLKSLLEAKFSFIYAIDRIWCTRWWPRTKIFIRVNLSSNTCSTTRRRRRKIIILKINQENFRIQKRSCTNAIYKLYKRKIDKDLDKIRTIERSEVPLFQADEVWINSGGGFTDGLSSRMNETQKPCSRLRDETTDQFSRRGVVHRWQPVICNAVTLVLPPTMGNLNVLIWRWHGNAHCSV